MGDPAWIQLTADGNSLVVFAAEEKDVWVFDLDAQSLQHRLTADPAD